MKRQILTPVIALSVAGSAMYLVGCTSPPKPAVVDGSSRVPANDPARIRAIETRVAHDRAELTETNRLRAKVDALQRQVEEMATIVREALTLPPPPHQVQPSGATSLKRPATLHLPGRAVAMDDSPPKTSRVFRVHYPFARTDFNPPADVAAALRRQLVHAEAIEVRGHTDSILLNPADRQIARERAARARDWLMQNGADPARIRLRFHSAGAFLADNRTEAGKAINRRVEIDLRLPSDQQVVTR